MTQKKETAVVYIVATTFLIITCALYSKNIQSGIRMLAEYRSKSLQTSIIQTRKITPTVNSVTPIITQPRKQLTTPTDSEPWGVARKVQEGTYTIKVGYDAHMASPQDILSALNSYRNAHGSGSLSWNDTLGQYAQSRADYFKSIGNSDAHAGFNSYLENENGFEKLGFNKVGENSYFGGPLEGPHLIEWVFAQSPGHNENQLSKDWSNVGIGITETSVDLIFGGN